MPPGLFVFVMSVQKCMTLAWLLEELAPAYNCRIREGELKHGLKDLLGLSGLKGS